jgi:hypothetical protein
MQMINLALKIDGYDKSGAKDRYIKKTRFTISLEKSYKAPDACGKSTAVFEFQSQ